MKYIYLNYPSWTSCRNARSFLEEIGVEYEDRHIIKNGPTKDEIRTWFERGNEPIEKYFNSRGKKYKELGLKEKMPTLSLEEKFELLGSDSMLVKRPMLICEDKVLIGFKKDIWKEVIK